MKFSTKWLGLARINFLLLILGLVVTACGDNSSVAVSPIAISIPSPAATATPPATTPVSTQAAKTTIAATTQAAKTTAPVTSLATVTPAPVVSATATSQSTAEVVSAGSFGYPFPGRWVVETARREIVIYAPGGGTGLVIPGGSTPVFSPDGKRVAYTTTDAPNGIRHITTIKAVDLDGKNTETLCEGPFGSESTWLVRWSPRNRFIAMYSRTLDSYSTDGELVLCDLNTKKFSAPLKFKQGGLNAIFDWSPDGDFALWEAEHNNLFNIYYGDPDKNGEDATTLPLNPPGRLPVNEKGDLSLIRYYTSARFSPDGTMLAVASNNVSLANVPGKTGSIGPKVFEDTPAGAILAWLPDGKNLALLDPASKTLQVLNIETGKKTTVASQVVAFDWTRK